jgi:hypothetical protein
MVITAMRQGEVLADRYRIVAQLARGGMGAVYKAEDLTLSRPVAIKFVPAGATSRADPRPFAQEARALARLSHPNILAIYDIGEAGGSWYLVTEYVEGRSLLEIFRDRAPLDPDYVLHIGNQIGQALVEMHQQGLIHRDIKPANVLVSESGRVLLADFGLALASGERTLTPVGTVIGTPKYMSPEQAMGSTLDSRSDMYSLAAVLYEALAGPTSAATTASPTELLKNIVEEPLPPVRDLNPQVPLAVSEILARALAKDRDDRYGSMEAFLRALRAASTSSALELDSSSALRPAGTAAPFEAHSSAVPPTSRALRPATVAAAALALALLAVGAGTLAARGTGLGAQGFAATVLLLTGLLGALVLLLTGLWPRLPSAPADLRARQIPPPSAEPSAGDRTGDDLNPTMWVSAHSPDKSRRLAKLEMMWSALSLDAIDEERFVSAAKAIARGPLREAVGYRIEHSIHYLKGTVGYMVDAPFMWIRVSRFPILFVAYDGRNQDLLDTVVQQLEIAKATEFFALLIVVPPRGNTTGSEAAELNQIVADSVYRHDFIVLDHQHLVRIIAENSSRALVEIILELRIELLASLSPYVVNGPVPDSMFFGRDSQLKTISQGINRTNFALVGGRRIGKSSVLLRLRRLLGDDPRYRPIYIDCEARLDYENFLATLQEYANLDVDAHPASFGRLAAALRERSLPRTVVFLLDEIDELLEFDVRRDPRGPLFKAFRAASQEGVCRFVFSGSRTLYRHTRDAQSPFFNFCETITLGRLQDTSTAEIVRKPLRQLGFDIPDEERLVARLIELTSSHPNIAQWTCDMLVKTSVGRQITVESVEQLASTPEFQEQYVSTAWGDASPQEKLISLVSDGPVFTDDDVRNKLAELNVAQDPNAIRESLSVLCLYSLLEREGSGYRFALTQFPRIVRESGVARTQVELLAHEVRSRCS